MQGRACLRRSITPTSMGAVLHGIMETCQPYLDVCWADLRGRHRYGGEPCGSWRNVAILDSRMGSRDDLGDGKEAALSQIFGRDARGNPVWKVNRWIGGTSMYSPKISRLAVLLQWLVHKLRWLGKTRLCTGGGLS